LLWQVTDIGDGYSTPAVVGTRIYLMSNRGMENEFVQALSTQDGKPIWTTRVGNVGNPNQNPPYPKARSTTTIDGDFIYALGSDVVAQKAAADHAAYVASNVGRIQFAQDSRFVLRQLGPTVVFFTWSPGGSPDPRLQSIQDALSTLGTEVVIPS